VLPNPSSDKLVQALNQHAVSLLSLMHHAVVFINLDKREKIFVLEICLRIFSACVHTNDINTFVYYVDHLCLYLLYMYHNT